MLAHVAQRVDPCRPVHRVDPVAQGRAQPGVVASGAVHERVEALRVRDRAGWQRARRAQEGPLHDPRRCRLIESPNANRAVTSISDRILVEQERAVDRVPRSRREGAMGSPQQPRVRVEPDRVAHERERGHRVVAERIGQRGDLPVGRGQGRGMRQRRLLDREQVDLKGRRIGLVHDGQVGIGRDSSGAGSDSETGSDADCADAGMFADGAAAAVHMAPRRAMTSSRNARIGDTSERRAESESCRRRASRRERPHPRRAWHYDGDMLGWSMSVPVPNARWLVAPVALAAGLVVGAPVGIGVASAQDACAAEAEPNGTEIELGAAPFTAGALCLTGTLPQGDQDLLLWEVAPEDALSSWSLTATGVPDTVTTFAIYPITSEPGVVPVFAGGKTFPTSTSRPTARARRSCPTSTFRWAAPRRRRAERPTRRVAAGGPVLEVVARARDPAACRRARAERRRRCRVPAHRRVRHRRRPGRVARLLRLDRARGGRWPGLGAARPRGPGHAAPIDIRGPDDTLVLNDSSDLLGRLDLYDLRLAPGTYTFYLTGAGEEAYPYRLTTTVGEPAGDPEPNDLAEQAIPVDLAAPLMRGRLAKDGDRDAYRISMAADATPIMRDIRLIWRSGRGWRCASRRPRGGISSAGPARMAPRSGTCCSSRATTS